MTLKYEGCEYGDNEVLTVITQQFNPDLQSLNMHGTYALEGRGKGRGGLIYSRIFQKTGKSEDGKTPEWSWVCTKHRILPGRNFYLMNGNAVEAE